MASPAGWPIIGPGEQRNVILDPNNSTYFNLRGVPRLIPADLSEAGWLGLRLKVSRIQAWRTQKKEVAFCLGVSPRTVANWEQGDNSPDVFFLARLADLYGVTVDGLLGR
jgi:DNA-binding XRE family transcriptional regulator